MAKYLTDELELQSVADAIRAKGGTSESLAFPNGFVSAIEGIETGGSGSTSISAKDVNFRDYDGTIVASYSAADFANLTALPANPSHDGLTAQGWNWSLTDAKTYVAKYGKLEIGQMYITNDGKTRVYIHLEQGRTSPMLGVCPNGTVDVDWGDGTAHDTLTGTSETTVQWTQNHVYIAPGDYVIKLTVTGSMGFYGTSSNYAGLLRFTPEWDGRNYTYRNAIKRIEIGNSVTSIGAYAFSYCHSLMSVTISDNITSIDTYAFSNCYHLVNVIIPNNITSIGTYAFYYCYNLASVTIPNNVTSIDSYVFGYCGSLANVTIPDSVTSIGSGTFYYCHGLKNITIPDKVTDIGVSTFYDCKSLANITIPDSVTSINSYAFYGCKSLANITIPDDVTSIGNSMFYDCCSLANITIPDGVTKIDTRAFNNCYSIAEYHFTSTTPPTLVNTNAFNGIPDDCIIYVPYSADHSILNAYKSASNWSSYASKMQEEPQ